MAEDIRHFTVTIPTGSTAASPAVIPLVMPVRVVVKIDWKVPPGAMGTTSFLVAMSGVPVLPVYGSSTYITTDGKDGTWELDKYPDSGGWEVIGYNTGTYAHTVDLTFYTNVPAPRPARRTAITAAQLMPVPDLSHAGPPVRRRS